MILKLTYVALADNEVASFSFDCRNESEALHFVKGFLRGNDAIKLTAIDIRD